MVKRKSIVYLSLIYDNINNIKYNEIYKISP